MAKTKGGTSSTKAKKPINVTVDKDSSLSVRQIENGFLVNESGTRGKGKNKEWYNKEYYSPTNPVQINGPSAARSGVKFGNKK